MLNTPFVCCSSLSLALATVAWADGFLDVRRASALLAVATHYGAPIAPQTFQAPPRPFDPVNVPKSERDAILEATSTLAIAVGSPALRETVAELKELFSTPDKDSRNVRRDAPVYS